MRRPTLCSNVATVEDCYSPVDVGNKEESRLSRMKRMLTGTLLMGRRGGRTFGLRLEELPTGRDGVPKVAVRLCGYIEKHGLKCGGLFRLSAGNPKLVERLRASFDRTGDADLEAAGDVATVASLLKLWLRELPEPVIVSHVAIELLDIHEKLHDETGQWREAVCQTLMTLPDPNICLLRYLLRFLRHYDQHGHRTHCHHHSNGGVASIFSPLLIQRGVEQSGRIDSIQQVLAHQLMNKLIHESNHIFQDRLVDQAIQAAVGEGSLHLFADASIHAPHKSSVEPVEVSTPASSHKHQHQHRKRKERHESFSSQSQERKVIRSNSEERPLEEGNINCKDSIRRVSSHEDFSLVKGGNRNNNNNINKSNSGKNFLSELIDPSAGHGVRVNTSLPLHERNSAPSKSAPNNDGDTTVVVAEMFDDNEHERRRNSERFARAATPRGRRNMARRRRIHKTAKTSPEDMDGGGSSKENEDQESETANTRIPHQQVSITSSTSDEDSSQDASSNSSSTHSFLQLHPQERERSPSPSPSPCTPPLDLSTLHQQVDCNEPLTSMGNWSFAHRQPEEQLVSSQVMLSPRNSMILTRRVYLDPSVPPSPPHEHSAPIPRTSCAPDPVDPDARLKQLTKQMNSYKKKLKRYEEEFEREYGYRPSHADKMGNKEVKKMCGELNKLRKEIKQLKEDPHSVMMDSPLTKPLDLLAGSGNNSKNNGYDKSPNMEEKFQEVEKHLAEKRLLAGRPESLDELTREQLLDEKVAVQKALLYLEGIFGRPVTKGDRDLVRPLYDRYRALKRLVIRTGPSKLKDSVVELATILEHETMDFTSSPPSLSAQEDTPEASAAIGIADLPTKFDQQSEPSDSLWENLHSLPLSELLSQQRSTREEKKRLRRSLREYEEDFQRRTGKKLQREDRIPMESIYVAYKQAKAKLRLLEALVAKQT